MIRFCYARRSRGCCVYVIHGRGKRRACPRPGNVQHCDKAVFAALVRIEGTLFVSGKNRYRVEIATDAPSVARLVIKLLHGCTS